VSWHCRPATAAMPPSRSRGSAAQMQAALAKHGHAKLPCNGPRNREGAKPTADKPVALLRRPVASSFHDQQGQQLVEGKAA